MIDWYIQSRKMLSELRKKAIDVLHYYEEDNKQAIQTNTQYMKSELQQLRNHWISMYPEEIFSDISRHMRFAEKHDFNNIIELDIPAIEIKLDQHLADFDKSLPKSKSQPYITEDRLKELESNKSKDFDTSKLLQLLREINVAYNNDAYLTIGILVRAVIDHIPPIFDCNTFSEIANHYKGTKSFKAGTMKLNDFLRNVADSYLHVPIRKIESLPTINQVDFRAEIDVLLSEVTRIIKGA